MRRLSYLLGLVAVALLVLSLASPARADAIDPAIGVKGCAAGSCSDPWPGSVIFHISPTPTVTIGDITMNNGSATCSDTTGLCNFTSGGWDLFEGTITNFLFDFGVPQEGGFSSAEEGETATQVSPSAALLEGFTISPAPVITILALSTLDATTGRSIISPFQLEMFDAPNGSNVTVTSNVSPVPEPGTIVLLGTGLGALALRRFRKKARV